MSSANRFQFQVMGGPAELLLVADEQRAAECARIVETEARRIEKKFSRYDAASLVSRINLSAGGKGVEVDSEMAALLDYAAVCHQQSEGLFDITSGILRRAWDFKARCIPTESQIGELLPLIGWQNVSWRAPIFCLPRVGMEIDFGGLGKEYAVDRCTALAQDFGISSGYINLAGDVRVLGRQVDGAPWRIGLVHPRRTGAVFGTVEVTSGAVATSGDYERYFESNGRRFCHILNPKTGWPVTGFQSVSVLAESCLIAGTASTIAMLLGRVAGVEFLKDLGLAYVVRDEMGEVTHSPQARLHPASIIK